MEYSLDTQWEKENRYLTIKANVFAGLAILFTLMGLTSIIFKNNKLEKEAHQIINAAPIVSAYINGENRTANHFYVGETAHNPKMRSPQLKHFFLEDIANQTPTLPKNEYGNVDWGKLQPGQVLHIRDLNGDEKATGEY